MCSGEADLVQAASCHQLGACWCPLRSGEPWAGAWKSPEPGSAAPRSLLPELRHVVTPRWSLIDVRGRSSGSEVRMPGKHSLRCEQVLAVSDMAQQRGSSAPLARVYLCLKVSRRCVWNELSWTAGSCPSLRHSGSGLAWRRKRRCPRG